MSATNKQSLDFEKPLLDLEKQLDDLMQSSASSDLDFTDEIRQSKRKSNLPKGRSIQILALGKRFNYPVIPTAHILQI